MSLKLTVVVDNQPGSSGIRDEHGLSMLVEVDGRSILFDTGSTVPVLKHNLEALHVDINQVDSLVLSHGHYDHTGGIRHVLSARPDIPLFIHPAFDRQRCNVRLTGEEHFVSIRVADQKAIQAHREHVRFCSRAVCIHDSPRCRVTISGAVPRPHRSSTGRLFLGRPGNLMVPDDVQDDMFLLVEGTTSAALVVGCCHAGIRNTLAHARALSRLPIRLVAGGTHLRHRDRAYLSALMEEMRAGGVQRVYPTHCSGPLLGPLVEEMQMGASSCAGSILHFDLDQ
eukprot:gnl/Dysnectes_brevis/1069_a1192_1895.p1 GENE.gnl/Dysnectes_brevis/1069_a1192_1895~~gnl/Dysnectes_brevis/1069_a1192_1895.p1  ORF type:complete len:283 (-),score=71.27 gnl/Dysnectes_brevis/1069_a1192_1895:357-1205(-)